MLTMPRKTAGAIYLAIAAVALIGTWGNNLHYFRGGTNVLDVNKHFWRDTFHNAASRSITVDIGLLTLAVVVWMVLEARRLQIKWVWLYVLFGGLIAISVTFPLFMFARERAAARLDAGEPSGRLTRVDALVLGVMAAGLLALAAYSLTR